MADSQALTDHAVRKGVTPTTACPMFGRPLPEAATEDAVHSVESHGLTEIGSARERNEDDFLILPLPLHSGSDPAPGAGRRGGLLHRTAFLLAVADGLGGAREGARASTIALCALRDAAKESLAARDAPEGSETGLVGVLKRAVLLGHHEIEKEARRRPGQAGLGTTLTAALVAWPRVFVVHVGDTRCYVHRGSRLRRVTADHTLAQRLIDLGLVSPDRLPNPLGRNVLWNSLGGGASEPRPQLRAGRLQWGDGILLASDGLTDSLSDRELRRLVRAGGPAPEICRRLIEAAGAHGGRDDRTVVYARFRRRSWGERIRRTLGSGAFLRRWTGLGRADGFARE